MNGHRDYSISFAKLQILPEIIRSLYETFLANANWQSLLQSLDGWQAVYDDHDFGVNNADKTNPFREESQRLFLGLHKLNR
jgi:hypothetical protein